MSRVLQELICINGQNTLYFHPLKLGVHLETLRSREMFPTTWLLLYRKSCWLITAIWDFTNCFHSSLLFPLISSFPISWKYIKIQRSLAGKFLDRSNMKWTKLEHQAQTREIQLCPAICWYLSHFPHVRVFPTKWSVHISNNFWTKLPILIVGDIKRKSCSQPRSEEASLQF